MSQQQQEAQQKKQSRGLSRIRAVLVLGGAVLVLGGLGQLGLMGATVHSTGEPSSEQLNGLRFVSPCHATEEPTLCQALSKVGSLLQATALAPQEKQSALELHDKLETKVCSRSPVDSADTHPAEVVKASGDGPRLANLLFPPPSSSVQDADLLCFHGGSAIQVGVGGDATPAEAAMLENLARQVLDGHGFSKVEIAGKGMRPLHVQVTLDKKRDCKVRDARFESVPFGENEEYELQIGRDGVQIRSCRQFGAVWGLTSLEQALVGRVKRADGKICVPMGKVIDKPQYPVRGMLLDTGRAYFTVDFVKRTLNRMRLLKMNVLHWHLVDDQSFSFQSTTYPVLAKKGAYHLGYNHDETNKNCKQPKGKSYTKEDLSEVVAYASSQGIRVMPELDMPGHARSWGLSEEMADILTNCPRYFAKVTRENPIRKVFGYTAPLDIRPGSRAFKVAEDLVEELIKVFPDPVFHLGFDEVSHSCYGEIGVTQAHIQEFLKHMSGVLIRHGRIGQFWDDTFRTILKTTLKPSNSIIHHWIGNPQWMHDEGFPFVYSNVGLYLDQRPFRLGPLHRFLPVQKTMRYCLGTIACAWEFSQQECVAMENDRKPKTHTFDVKVWRPMLRITAPYWNEHTSEQDHATAEALLCKHTGLCWPKADFVP